MLRCIRRHRLGQAAAIEPRCLPGIVELFQLHLVSPSRLLFTQHRSHNSFTEDSYPGTLQVWFRHAVFCWQFL